MKNWVIRGLFYGTCMLIGTCLINPLFFGEELSWSRIWIRALIFYPVGLAMFYGFEEFTNKREKSRN
jgi:hypothetical protein